MNEQNLSPRVFLNHFYKNLLMGTSNSFNVQMYIKIYTYIYFYMFFFMICQQIAFTKKGKYIMQKGILKLTGKCPNMHTVSEPGFFNKKQSFVN